MAIAKVILNGTTLIDTTSATASAEDITAPKTAMLANGVMTTGTGTGGGNVTPLTINPTESVLIINAEEPTATHIGNVHVHDDAKTITRSIDLSSFSIGDTCHVIGTLYIEDSGTSISQSVQDIEETFTWGSTNSYTKGYYTLTFTSSSVTIACTYSSGMSLNALIITSENDHCIKIEKLTDNDFIGYNPVTIGASNEILIILRTITSYENSTISYIGSTAFMSCASLSYLSLARCRSIYSSAFMYCYNLSQIYIPLILIISAQAFYGCSKISSIDLFFCTLIGTSAFANCSALTSVSMSYCNNIGTGAFSNCKSLSEAIGPQCLSIGAWAFSSCASLQLASFKKCTDIGSSAFYFCSRLVSAYFPSLPYVAASAFYSCNYLSSVVLGSNCSYIGICAFLSCSRLTSISLPQCTNISMSAFAFADLSTLELPSCTTISSYAFRNNSHLSIVSLPVCNTLQSYVFVNCTKLSKIYLMRSIMTALANVNAFSNTPIYSGSGSIYVPTSLLTSYQAATNWILFSSFFVGV